MQFIVTEVRPERRAAQHHITTKRMPRGHVSPNATHYVHMAGTSLWPIEFQGEGWQWGSITSRLQVRAVRLMRADEDVLAVTCLEW